VTRVAAIDCGTNSIRLLVADVSDGVVTDVDRRMEIVRLGEGVDRTGKLSDSALDRTMTALRSYASIVASTGASAVAMVATSATRDASNSAEFVRRVKEILGVSPTVLSGSAEARLSYLGATATLTGGAPYLVTDIGGGSTEFVLGPEVAASVDIGCVRLTERHLHSDPPTASEISAARADIDAALSDVELAVPVGEARTLVGLAGSVTTIAGIALDLPSYDSTAIHHSVIPAADVRRIAVSLLGQPRAVRARIGVMHPGRVDVIGGGALILDAIMTRFEFPEVLVSETDILDGIALDLAGRA
jgi:exopolyphosphatase / guanosine-5'-triphosphate,3'-diphosphate pyrophosphatase